MEDCFKKILDAVDIETYFACKDEAEGRALALNLLEKFGLKDIDIVFIEFTGPGARVRARGYVYRPGDHYGWLEGGMANE
ncbi:MAG: hypothetical protein ACOY3J_06480 [Bacillota bacterium]|uniref:Peptidase M20 n=1 Tax=Thermanaerosceptrum fracticalcis TaxID=1712410 RepID=A0A7G6E688_THEFR|nr:hypothetical protein [Thermanaerosceptrum fracticalcis]QNB47592.1 hypothetical protein BR63_15710 [Thermanaerosceptrum fracticalcis]